jgi:glyoxylase-like metal-dependent hydrolase (beta-lactamase superfamily II)
MSPLYPTRACGFRHTPAPVRTQHSELSEFLSEWTFIHTPGHTPGYTSLFRNADRVLIAGDAVWTTKPESFFDAAIAQPPEMRGPPAYLTPDRGAAIQSIRKLTELDPAILATGRGKPLLGGVSGRLRGLASEPDTSTTGVRQKSA